MYKMSKKYNKTKSKWEFIGLYICDSCNKPVSEKIDSVMCVDGKSEKKFFHFHKTPMECAYAEPERQEIRRHSDTIKVPKARRR